MTDTEFDSDFYVSQYPDVLQTSLSPKEHYDKYGVVLGRSKNKSEYISAFCNGRSERVSLKYSIKELSAFFSKNTIPSVFEKNLPKVSLVVTNYNNSSYLKEAVNSALSQTGVCLEIIVVDDGSSDSSLQVLKSLELDDRVKVISLLRNFGCYYARNIGVSLSTGDYIGFLDSDDVMHPDRLKLQVQCMENDESILMSISKMRRWSERFEKSISDFKYGEVTAVFKRKVFDKIGFFDTVKYGADEEFRKRLDRVYSIDCVKNLDDELYYARTVGSSLTASGKNAIFSIEEGKLKFKKSESRSMYSKNFRDWHRQFKGLSDKSGLYVSFPQLKRAIALHDSKQNASPFLNQKVIGCMATFPARKKVLKRVLSSILDQLDELHIYLNDYVEVPDFLNHSKITCYLGNDELGDLRDNGKFFKLSKLNGYIFTLDDDIFYPKDYVRWMLHYIEVFNRSTVVGVHGVIYPSEKKGYMQGRTVLHFSEKAKGQFVDSLGTGTVAFHSSLIDYDLRAFETKGVCDLWFARACHVRNIPLLSVPREAKWLIAAESEGVNLFNEAKKNKKIHDALYHENLYTLLVEKASKDKFSHLVSSLKSDNSLHFSGFSLVKPSASKRSVVSLRPYVINHINPVVNKVVNAQVHFHVVVNGWNCSEFVSACLESLASQQLGGYSVEFTFIDDGSDDDTLDQLVKASVLPKAKIISNEMNMGPAYTRDTVIRNIINPDAVVVLVDLDDELFSEAFKVVANVYNDNVDCMMTLGNWKNQNGRPNPLPFYDSSVIDAKSVRDIEKFHAAPLRTFRRKLYDEVQEEDLKGPDGEWLQTCTDVAIMYPLLDQCRSENVVFIDKYLYMYNEKTSFGTLSRFGKPYKNERLAWLKSKPKKERYF